MIQTVTSLYSKTYLKRPLKNRQNKGLKGMLLSKALTCMKFFLHKQNSYFIKETDISTVVQTRSSSDKACIFPS